MDTVAHSLTRTDLRNAGGVRGSLCNLFPNQFLIAQALIIYTKVKKLVEVEVVLHQKADIACLELHSLVAQDL